MPLTARKLLAFVDTQQRKCTYTHLEFLMERTSRNFASQTLSKDIHRERERRDSQVRDGDDRENRLRADLLEPSVDEVTHDQRKQRLDEIHGHECLGGVRAVTVHDVCEHGARGERNGSRLHAEEGDGDGDVCAGCDAIAEADVCDGAANGGDDHEYEAKLGLVDTIVLSGHELYDSVGAVAGDESADKTDTEEGEVGESDGRGAEIVRRGGENGVLKKGDEGEARGVYGVGERSVDDGGESDKGKGLERQAPEASI